METKSVWSGGVLSFDRPSVSWRRRFAMAEKVFIVGNVTSVVDGETFQVAVDRIGRMNLHGCGDTERVHMKKLKLQENVWMTGVFTKPQLEKMFRGRQVLCLVKSRDLGGRIVADVQVM
jgi:endonuclease YncB( thermonuclease family)